MDTRPFPIADILAVLTGRPVGNALRVLNWMSGERPPLWAIRDHSRRCQSALRVDHPDIAAVTPPSLADEDALAAWVQGMAARFGPTRDVARLGAAPEQEWTAAA